MVKIISTGTSGNSTKRKKWLILASAVLVIAVVGVLVALNQKRNVTEPARNDVANQGVHKQTATEKASAVAGAGDYAGGQKVLDETVSSTANDVAKASVYVEKAQLAMNNKKADDALTFAMKAEDLVHTRSTSRLLAEVYKIKNDKANVVKHYELTLSRYSESDKKDGAIMMQYGEDKLTLEEWKAK